jgi:hypothetical protein
MTMSCAAAFACGALARSQVPEAIRADLLSMPRLAVARIIGGVSSAPMVMVEETDVSTRWLRQASEFVT